MRRLQPLLVALALCVALSSCGGGPNTPAGGAGTGGTGGGGTNYSGTQPNGTLPYSLPPNGTLPNASSPTDLGLVIPLGQGYPSRGGNFTVSVQWTKGPGTAVYNSCVLTFADKNHRTLASFSLQSFIPWNYALGQGSSTVPIPLSPSLRNPAVITASNFILPYAGQWYLQVTATANGVSDVADLPFTAI